MPAVRRPIMRVPEMDAWITGITSPSSLSNADCGIRKSALLLRFLDAYIEVGRATDRRQAIAASGQQGLESKKAETMGHIRVCKLGEDANVATVLVLEACGYISQPHCANAGEMRKTCGRPWYGLSTITINGSGNRRQRSRASAIYISKLGYDFRSRT